MLKTTGIPSQYDLLEVTPSLERIRKGPVAVIECFQEIPCNPCSTSCKVNAISEMKNINERPVINHDKCTGCGICISACPGLAIFGLDASYFDKKAIIKLPYEMLPIPAEGQIVTALNREGVSVGEATVIKIQRFKLFEKTPVVWLTVDEDLVMEVRNFRMEVHNG